MQNNQSPKLGIFGGSFNPVHAGHYEIVNQVIRKKLVDYLIVLPTFQNPFKSVSSTLPTELRWKMLEATFNSLDKVEISNYEIAQQKQNFSYQSILHFLQLYPKSKLSLILGEDSYLTIRRWKNPNIIVNNCSFILFKRNVTQEKTPVSQNLISSYKNNQDQELMEKTSVINVDIPDISSTLIRTNSLDKIKQNSWLTPGAFEIWKKFKLTEQKEHYYSIV